MLYDGPEEALSSIEDLVVEREEPLAEDIILVHQVILSCEGKHEFFCVGQKGQKPWVSKWYTSEDGESQFLLESTGAWVPQN